MDVAVKVPNVVEHKIFGESPIPNAHRRTRSLFKQTRLSELDPKSKFRHDLGYNYTKLSKKTSLLPFTLIASDNAESNIKDIFVHVHSQPKKEMYPGLLGKGWYADTELAQNLRTKEWVAVKCYKHTQTDRKIPQVLIEKEMKVLKVVDAFRGYAEYKNKHGQTKRNVYMKLFDGSDLQQIKKSQMPTKLSKRISCAVSLIRELEKLHQSNFIHGDIHRGNVIINPATGKAHLIDYNKSEYLNENHEAKVIQGGYPINIPGKVRDKLDKGCMTLNKYTDRFALGTTLAYLFNEKVHPSKNGDGFVDRLLVKKDKQHTRCSEGEWKNLDSILKLMTDPQHETYLSDIVNKLEQLRTSLQSQGL